MKYVLDSKDTTEIFFRNTKLMGVMASLKDYQFCWHINQLMGIDFRINNEIEIQLTRKKRNYFFAVYEYHEQHRQVTHYLYNNQFDGEYLLPEFKHLDFLWLVKGEDDSGSGLFKLPENIRSIKGVQLVLELNHNQIRNKEHLVF